jgi:hypothetical protein
MNVVKSGDNLSDIRSHFMATQTSTTKLPKPSRLSRFLKRDLIGNSTPRRSYLFGLGEPHTLKAFHNGV